MTTTANNQKIIRLILGDQLNLQHSWFNAVDENILYVLMEVKPESEYVTHHIQKIVGIFQAMRHFAQSLEDKGHRVRYYRINDKLNLQSFSKNISELSKEIAADKIEYQEPDEYRLDQQLKTEFEELDVQVQCVGSEHFFTGRYELKEMFKDKKSYLMETFYRNMRKTHKVLMDGDQPVTGKWNYDKENRKKLPKRHNVPTPYTLKHNVEEILADIEAADIQFIGEIDPKGFIWPKSSDEARDVLDYFINTLFSSFGTYQDAMSDKEWSLYHSRISFAMNVKMISPRDVVSKAEEYWCQNPNEISISQAEGFIRQILGWREYMRGIYWAHMPDYSELNYFGHKRQLPHYYWDADTKMNCMHKAISQSLQYSYAHHIQRLMITGNFALLAGIDPDEVDEWYLGIYIDAFDWVEITNTRGMSQFADGGIVGTKPYTSSASYIHKMGDHCSNCHYDHKKKIGDGACPFNSLYWYFLEVNRELLSANPRMTMMYRVLDKMSQKDEIIAQGQTYLDQIEEL